MTKIPRAIYKRLEYFRQEIKAERITYGEIVELQSLADYIDPGDALLLEWAGVLENDDAKADRIVNAASDLYGNYGEVGQVVAK